MRDRGRHVENSVRKCVCVCVCVREREREREKLRITQILPLLQSCNRIFVIDVLADRRALPDAG